MMIDQTLDRGSSPLHRVDPRARVVAAVGFSLAVVLAPTWQGALLGLVFGAVFTGAARIPLHTLSARLLAVNGFIVFLWCVLPFTVPGTKFFEVGMLAATREGATLAWVITLKSNAVLLAFLALISTISVPALGYAMGTLRVPSKLVYLFLFTARYVHVIMEEYRRLARAARVRGFAPGTSLHTYKTVADMFAMLLVRSGDRAFRVHQAMVLRGFQGRFHSLDRFTVRQGDVLFLAVVLTGVLAILYLY
jgi:cobalt/nickel transport system permease protein